MKRRRFAVGANVWITTPGVAGVATQVDDYKLYCAIREDRRTTWEFRIKVITVDVTALTGLAGAAIGLVAIWKK